MAGTIVQTGIGLEQETLHRCDRLRACYGRSRSWVIERALTTAPKGMNSGLAALESEKFAEVRAFNDLAGVAGVSWQEYAARYVRDFGAKTYPPTVETLALIGYTGTETAKSLKGKMLRAAVVQRAQQGAEEVSAEIDCTAQEARQVVTSLRDLRS